MTAGPEKQRISREKAEGEVGDMCSLETKRIVRYHGMAANYLRLPDAGRRLMKDALKMKNEMEGLRAKRADLFRLAGEVPDYHEEGAFAQYAGRVLEYDLPPSDRRIMEKIICDGELLHLLEKALASRVGGRNEAIIKDYLFGKMKEEDLAGKYDISLRTIRRIKRAGRQAVNDEIALRKAVLPELSW